MYCITVSCIVCLWESGGGQYLGVVELDCVASFSVSAAVNSVPVGRS